MNKKYRSKVFGGSLAVTIYILTSVATVSADEWYSGGNLHGKDNVAWIAANYANKLATAADTITTLYTKNVFVEEIQDSLNGYDMNVFKVYATELVACIDIASEVENMSIQYSDLAIGCVSIMEWIKI